MNIIMSLKKDDLYKKHDQISNLKKQTYEQIYKRCVNQIKLTADTGELLCFFEIPHFLWGSEYPIINIQACATFIIEKLNHLRDITVNFIEPNILFIDWRRDIK